ncbi:EamA family transporter, partial [Klebsiella pneumoniae]
SILLIIPLVIGILITLIPKKTVVDKNKMNS